ncbi:YkvA family protein [Falsiroseomonas sp.]|uniref:YkvA family protein n=1 Tax=Falsiroseomonas sp. TaxID=2870721 RepID=UPI003F6FFD88
MPVLAKLLCAAIAAYALSPIDLIPDFIPVLGLLDEAILLPLGILLAVRLVPPALMAAFRAQAERQVARPVSRVAAAFIIALWLAGAALLLVLLWPGPAEG